MSLEQAGENLWDNDLSESPFPVETSFIKDNRFSEDRWRQYYIAALNTRTLKC